MNNEEIKFTKTLEEMQEEVRQENEYLDSWKGMLTSLRLWSMFLALSGVCFLIIGFLHRIKSISISYEFLDFITKLINTMTLSDILLVVGVLLVVIAIIIKRVDDRKT